MSAYYFVAEATCEIKRGSPVALRHQDDCGITEWGTCFGLGKPGLQWMHSSLT